MCTISAACRNENNGLYTFFVYSMALPSTTAPGVFVLALALACVGCSTSHSLKGSVSCLDCDSRNDLAGVAVAIKCKHDAKQAIAFTDGNGCFEAEVPSNASPDCVAKLLGGPKQFCSYKQFMTARAPIEGEGTSHGYTFSTPLIFFSSCSDPKPVRARGKSEGFGSSKTIDLHLPRDWGLAPPSHYVPIIPMPIIGIP